MREKFRRKSWFVADGHKTQNLEEMTYLSVLSKDSVQISLTIAERNGLEILECEIHNAYLAE